MIFWVPWLSFLRRIFGGYFAWHLSLFIISHNISFCGTFRLKIGCVGASICNVMACLRWFLLIHFCRYKLVYSSNYSHILDPLIENNYQLFMIERLVMMGAKTFIKTFKEDEKDLSLTDDPKKNTNKWQIPVYTMDEEGSWHGYNEVFCPLSPTRVIIQGGGEHLSCRSEREKRLWEKRRGQPPSNWQCKLWW